MKSGYDLLLLNVLKEKRKNHNYFNDSLGQHLIAEYVKKGGFCAKVYSGSAKDVESVIKNEVITCGVTVIGFYVAADNLTVTRNVIKHIKRVFDKILILVGGPQTVAFTEESLREYRIDYAIVGEGEKVVLELLKYIINGQGNLETIPSLKYFWNNYYRENTTEGASVLELDDLPFPKYENSLNRNFRMGEIIGILTGRGCPFSCSFCYEGTNTKNVRFRSVKNVMEEIDYVREHNPNLKAVNIYDDTFTLNRERLLEFCREIRARNLMWYCEGHVAYLSKNLDLIPVMKESGLVGIQLGIESGSNKVLKAYNKKITPKEILAVIKSIKAAGVKNICGNLIIGGAMEDCDTLKETLEFGRKLIEIGRGIIELATVYFSPYPYTKMSVNPEEYQMKINCRALEVQVESMRGPVVETAGLTIDEIWKAKKRIDYELQEEYIRQAHSISRSELLQGLLVDGMQTTTNYVWRNLYGQIEHLRNFLNHLEEEEFHLEYYPMRTFDDFVIHNSFRISTRMGVFEEKEAQLLILSNGNHTASEIKEIMNISENELVKLYKSMNERCLLYMSKF